MSKFLIFSIVMVITWDFVIVTITIIIIIIIFIIIIC